MTTISESDKRYIEIQSPDWLVSEVLQGFFRYEMGMTIYKNQPDWYKEMYRKYGRGDN